MSDKLANTCYALLRIVTGFMFSFHGAQKILGLFIEPSKKPELWSQLWVGGIIELAGGLLVMVGYQTRLAAFFCSGMMAVAYFQFHWKFQLGEMILPGMNQGEMAALYCFVFLYIACRGGVKWCIDRTK